MGTRSEFAAVKWLVARFSDLVGPGATARNGTPDEDTSHIADAWVDRPDQNPISVGVRMRQPECDEREFTVRLRREGRPTEFAALRGEHRTYDWYLYLWLPYPTKLGEFVLLDINKMRDAGLFGQREGEWRQCVAPGGFETYYAMDVEKLIQEGHALKARVYHRAPLSDFLEELVGKDDPLRLLEL